MPFTDEEKTAGEVDIELALALQQSHASSLDEITHLLHHMLTFAELSAIDINADRELLQNVFDYLRNEIDRIADTL